MNNIEYTFINGEGRQFRVGKDGLGNFCKEHYLDRSNINRLIDGTRPSVFCSVYIRSRILKAIPQTCGLV